MRETIEAVRVRDFRCFGGAQEARLAPLTLLVGANSTGKTSFMAMFRAICEVAYSQTVPDFKKEPFELGSFDDMAHCKNGQPVDSFSAGFTERHPEGSKRKPATFSFDATFVRSGTAPIPIERRISDHEQNSVVCREERNGDPHAIEVRIETQAGEERWRDEMSFGGWGEEKLTPLYFLINYSMEQHKPQISVEAQEKLRRLSDLSLELLGAGEPPIYTGAPVRSKPKRTYDPKRPARDPEGDYIPALLAAAARKGGRSWSVLKKRIEDFGLQSGLFNDLNVQPKGELAGDPFQIQVKHRNHDPWRNLMDMGYGVNQILPIVTELSRSDSLPISLLQQPEVHLHPSAQAALGTLFCHLADQNHNLIVETHSDHLINRVRMDIRDRVTDLTTEDVSVLYFERSDDGVQIHSLNIDKQGNLDSPTSYGEFFMQEINRELKI